MLRTQAGGMMDMAGLTNILAGAGAGHRISIEGETGDQPGQSMEVSDAETIDQAENTPES